MERNTQPSNVRAEAGLSFYTLQWEGDWKSIFDLRKAAVKYPGTDSIAVLDNRPDTCLLYTSKTSRSEIENVVGKEIGGYLTKLEKEYEIISKKQPLFEKSSAKNVRRCV